MTLIFLAKSRLSDKIRGIKTEAEAGDGETLKGLWRMLFEKSMKSVRL
jgi:hypothetical protein